MLILPSMKIIDTFTIDASPKKTDTGFLVANVRAVRTGIQSYTGAEMGRPDLAVVNVYRPEAEVFHKDSVMSFAGVTLTNNHPNEPVTAENWKDFAAGEIVAGPVMRDGEYMMLQIMVRDAATIKDIENGKRELSAGYDADIVWQDGVTPDGLTYQAIQTNIRANHLSIVDFARGGSKLKIGDNLKETKSMKNIIVDGLLVEVTDGSEAAIRKLTTDRDTANSTITARDAEIARLNTELSARTGEIAVLNQKVKDAELTPEALATAVAARAAVVDTAKTIVKDFDATGKTDAAIKREVVKAKIGDAAIALDDAAIAGAFVAIAADKPNTSVRDSLGVNPTPAQANVVNFADAKAKEDASYNAMLARLANGGAETA